MTGAFSFMATSIQLDREMLDGITRRPLASFVCPNSGDHEKIVEQAADVLTKSPYHAHEALCNNKY